MKNFKFHIVLLFFAIVFSTVATAQGTSVTDRTPEQEATKQTEKLQKELNLTPEQAKNVYDINLKYARERKQSNRRTEAVTRIMKKNEEINRVLSNKQKDELQSKRSRVQSVEIDGERRVTVTNPNNRSFDVRRDALQSSYQERLGDRPVRTDRSVRDANQNQQRSVGRVGDRPVRSSDSRVVRPGTPTSSRQSNQSRDVRSAPSGRSSSGTVNQSTQRQSTQSRQSSAPSRENPRPVRSNDNRR